MRYLKSLKAAWSEVFSRTSYILGAAAVAFLVFAFTVFLPNLSLLNEVIFNSGAPISAKVKVAWSLLGGIRTNFSTLSATYTILVALLVGVNAAMIVYLLKKQSGLLNRREAMAGVGGIASGALGIGCAACGSFLLSAILSSFGAAGALALLPLKGGEFGILSVVLLGATLGIVSNSIAKPLTCNIKEEKNNHE
jgi:hypothetical protein